MMKQKKDEINVLFSDTPKHFWEKWLGGGKKKDEGDDNAEMSNGSIDDWLGVRRPGMKHEHKEGYANDDPLDESVEEFESSESDDDDDHGGQMMPVPGM